MTSLPKLLVLLLALAPAARTRAAISNDADTNTGLGMASQYTLTFDAVDRFPSRVSTDAALMGNGDLLVAFGPKQRSLEFSIGKNDLWLMREKAGSKPMPLALFSLDFPALKGAMYQINQNLGSAISTGKIGNENGALKFETGVFATENLLWIRLESTKGRLEGVADLTRAGTTSLALKGKPDRIQIGRDAKKGGQWYYNGLIESLALYDRAMTASEISSLMAGKKMPGLSRDFDFTSNLDPALVKGNVTLVNGRNGRKAARFDGQTGYLDTDPWENPKNAFTLSAWVNIDRTKDKGATLLAQSEWGRYWSLGWVDGRLRVILGDRTIEIYDGFPRNRWVHVAVTYDGSSTAIYIDGQRVRYETTEGWAFTADKKGPIWTAYRDTEGQDAILRRSAAMCAVRNLNGNLGSLLLEPGKPVTLVVAVDSLEKNSDFINSVKKQAADITEAKLLQLRAAHAKWWADFWNRSYIQIPDKVLEKQYYTSHYALASASRDPAFPPGLFGWTTADDPLWLGDYHLNYNHVAPYYSLVAANHVEQADPCIAPILDNIEEAKANAKRDLKIEGAYQRVGIGPKGSVADANFHGQKSNSAMSCVPIAARWYGTYDLDFAHKAYPFVREVARFWENYLKWDGTHYNITNDAVHENSGPDMNPIHSLALVRQVMNLATDMSTELKVDAEARKKWQEIAQHLAPYPTFFVRDLPEQFYPAHLPKNEETNSLRIFRYTEKGNAWWKGNTLGIQHIFPGNGLGLGSDPALLEIGRNQITVMNRWVDYNGMNSFYVAAARVGYDPKIILSEMRKMIESMALPNGMIKGNSHGAEHFSIVPNAVQEMLFQSYDGTLRFFPDWPMDQDARFSGLRARGAFLVASGLSNGRVQFIRLVSEKGRFCVIQNPWPASRVRITRSKDTNQILEGAVLNITTSPGEQIEIFPVN